MNAPTSNEPATMTDLRPPADAQPTPWPPPSGPPGMPAVHSYIPAVPQLEERRAPHPTLPWQAGVGALVVLTISLLVSKFLLDLIVDFEWPIVVYVVLLGVTGYGPSLLWWQYSSRRWGSGRPVDDVGLRPRLVDLAWGPVIWLAAIGCQLVVGAIVLAFDVPLSNNTDGIAEFQTDRTYIVAIVITAVVAAPIVEELVFRGLVMRSLLGSMPAAIAVVLQGVLFGVAHIDPVRGVGNVGLALVLSGVGIALGGAAYLLRRIGPTVVAHAIFNGVVMILVLSGVSDRLREENPDPFGSVARSAVVEVAVVDQPDIAEPDRGGDPHRAALAGR